MASHATWLCFLHILHETCFLHRCRCDQSILTGESGSIEKSTEPVDSRKAVYQDKTCIMFSVRLWSESLLERVGHPETLLTASFSLCPSHCVQGIAPDKCIPFWVITMKHRGDLSQGTVVTAGRARAIVIGTGARTAIGKIHDAMTDQVSLCSVTGCYRLL